jgi:hypothetical protein
MARARKSAAFGACRGQVNTARQESGSANTPVCIAGVIRPSPMRSACGNSGCAKHPQKRLNTYFRCLSAGVNRWTMPTA